MQRTCGICGARLLHARGHDDRDDDFRGNAVEVDDFDCTGCGRRFRHVYRERFGGDSESWAIVEGDTTRALPNADWPRTA